MCVLGLALAAIGTIAAVCTAAASAASIAPPAARFFALRARRTIAVLWTGVRALRHGRARLLLLRTRLALLIGPTLRLRLLTCLRLLLPLLRNFSARLLAVRAVRARLLLLRRPLIAPWLLVALRVCIAIAALMVIRTAATAFALLVAATFATSATAIASAAPASATLASATLVPVARFVVPTFRALRLRWSHRRFVCGRRLLGRLVRFEPAKQEAEDSWTRRFRCCDCSRGGGRHRRCR